MEEIFSIPWPLCLLHLSTSLHKKFVKATSSIRLLLKPHPCYAVKPDLVWRFINACRRFRATITNLINKAIVVQGEQMIEFLYILPHGKIWHNISTKWNKFGQIVLVMILVSGELTYSLHPLHFFPFSSFLFRIQTCSRFCSIALPPRDLCDATIDECCHQYWNKAKNHNVQGTMNHFAYGGFTARIQATN